jgi:hypothetical protein
VQTSDVAFCPEFMSFYILHSSCGFDLKAAVKLTFTACVLLTAEVFLHGPTGQALHFSILVFPKLNCDCQPQSTRNLAAIYYQTINCYSQYKTQA